MLYLSLFTTRVKNIHYHVNKYYIDPNTHLTVSRFYWANYHGCIKRIYLDKPMWSLCFRTRGQTTLGADGARQTLIRGNTGMRMNIPPTKTGKMSFDSSR